MSNITTIVKSIQDIMRKDAGTYGDAQRLEQLGWMLFLKIFDDREKEMELVQDGFRSPLPKALRWSEWAADEEGITGEALLGFVNNELMPKLKTLSGASKLSGIIRMTFSDANNYMKNGTLLRQVVNKINGIDFNASDDRHMFGDIYEKLLRDLQAAGNAGDIPAAVCSRSWIGDCQRKPALDFYAERKRGQKYFPGEFIHFRQGECRAGNRAGRMRDRFQMRIVERVGGRTHAVDHGGAGWIQLLTSPEQRHCAATTARQTAADGGVDHLRIRTTERAADPVNECAHGLATHRLRQIIPARAPDEIGKHMSDGGMSGASSLSDWS